jgi:hypothetical protein
MWKEYRTLIVLALVGAVGYGIYMLNRYIQVEIDLNRRSAIRIQPQSDDNSISEIGYIESMRDELFLHEDNTINLVWFIKVPATGQRYSCSWESGFSRFEKGDDVRIIRPKDLSKEAGYGYIVGLHNELEGKASQVWVIDEESLEIDLEPDQ